MSTEKAISTQETAGIVPAFNLANGSVPNLSEAREGPADLTSEYWTPEKEGEFKLVFFQNIESSIYEDQNTGEEVELPCAIMIEQKADLSLVTIRNGGKRLVAALEEAEASEKIAAGTPLKITFLGKQKNKTNSNMSDRWSIRPLSA